MYGYECFQKEQLIKEILLVENHLANFVCPHCLHKHSLTTQALAEETLKITPIASEQDLMKKIISQFRNPVQQKDLNFIRDLRKKLMEITPNPCDSSKENDPPARRYLPHGLTEIEKQHQSLRKKLSSCIKQVEEKSNCTPPYKNCPVNPVAVCRASIEKH